MTRVKWNRCHHGAPGTFGPDLDSLTFAGGTGNLDRFEPLILGLFTIFAALGWILKLFVQEKGLLARRPYKVLKAVNTFYCGVGKFIVGIDRNWRGLSDLLDL